jgi:hypothetical protein
MDEVARCYDTALVLVALDVVSSLNDIAATRAVRAGVCAPHVEGQILADGALEELFVRNRKCVQPSFAITGAVEHDAGRDERAHALKQASHLVLFVPTKPLNRQAQLQDVVTETLRDGVVCERDLHKIEGQVQVGSEVVEATLQESTKLDRIGLHACAMFCLGRLLATLSDRPAELHDLLLHPIDLGPIRQSNDPERAVVAEYEVFDRAYVSPQLAPVVCQRPETRNAFGVVDGTSHRRQQSMRGVIAIPLRRIDGGLAAIERHDAVG